MHRVLRGREDRGTRMWRAPATGRAALRSHGVQATRRRRLPAAAVDLAPSLPVNPHLDLVPTVAHLTAPLTTGTGQALPRPHRFHGPRKTF